MSVTRREVLIGMGAAVLAAACSSGSREPIKSHGDSGRFEHSLSLKYDANARRVLKDILTVDVVQQIQEAIGTYFKNPFALLAELEKASVDRDDFTHYPGRWSAVNSLGQSFLGVTKLECTIRGTGGTGGLEASLGKHLFLTTSIQAFPHSGDVERLQFITNLRRTFGTGLTPDVDQYIDTSRFSSNGRIAEKDLLAAGSEVLNLPEGLEWTLSKESVYKTLGAELALKSPKLYISYRIGQSCSMGIRIDKRPPISQIFPMGEFPYGL